MHKMSVDESRVFLTRLSDQFLEITIKVIFKQFVNPISSDDMIYDISDITPSVFSNIL